MVIPGVERSGLSSVGGAFGAIEASGAQCTEAYFHFQYTTTRVRFWINGRNKLFLLLCGIFRLRPIALRCCLLRLFFVPPTKDAGEESSNSFLIVSIFRIFRAGDILRDRCRALKDCQIRDHASSSPIEICLRLIAAPCVQNDPDALLSSEVGMTAVFPKACGAESAIHLCSCPALRNLREISSLVL
jgi:hypothetical protein